MLRRAWLAFRGLTPLEQGCWAFVALAGIVCLTVRVRQVWGI
jgi:hypothetical protein